MLGLGLLFRVGVRVYPNPKPRLGFVFRVCLRVRV